MQYNKGTVNYDYWSWISLKNIVSIVLTKKFGQYQYKIQFDSISSDGFRMYNINDDNEAQKECILRVRQMLNETLAELPDGKIPDKIEAASKEIFNLIQLYDRMDEDEWGLLSESSIISILERYFNE